MPNDRWPYCESTHLIADTAKELYEFSEKIHLKREWVQGIDDKYSMLHFDSTPALAAWAVRNGAVKISIAEFGRKSIEYKKNKKRLEFLMGPTDELGRKKL